jgi:hypothetical protein
MARTRCLETLGLSAQTGPTRQNPREKRAVKVILASILTAVVLAIGASFVLNATQRPAYQVYSAPQGARVGDPGHNLVGPDYSAKPGKS